jgi:histone H3/H4
MSSPVTTEVPTKTTPTATFTEFASKKNKQPTNKCHAPASIASGPANTPGKNPPSSNTTSIAAAAPASSSGAPPSAVEFEPPVACVRRILKNALHSHTNVGKDSVTAFARASGIFIIYLTACANDFARENRRQTITANDVLAAIKVR